MDNHLHIITLNIPYPPDYGGIIDSFYRLRSLNDAGIRIHLHCFEYGRVHSPELESLCHTINYYRRDSSLRNHFSLKPFTVISRSSTELLENLQKDEHPIFFDGLHTTYYLDHQALSGRRKIVRVHNVEHSYYRNLALFEKNPLKKFYYYLESLKLKSYEKVLGKADVLLSVSDSEQEHFEGLYSNSELLPSFHPGEHVDTIPGSGDYIIYHADLSVNENAIVAEYLITKIFSQLPYRCTVAGKNPSRHLVELASSFGNITIVPDPDNERMTELIKNAHINLLYTISSVGLRLKLLIALFTGRHCIVNSNMIWGTLLGPACIIEDSADVIIEKVHTVMKQPFTEGMIADREKMLLAYTNSFNCKRLTRIIFPE